MEPEPNTPDGFRIGDPGRARSRRVVPAREVGDGPRRSRAAAAAGWFGAAAVVFTGGFLMWHLLFGAAVGGDVWLGRPLAEASSVDGAPARLDSFPEGTPYVPGTSVAARTVDVAVPEPTTDAPAPTTTTPNGQAGPTTTPQTTSSTSTTVDDHDGDDGDGDDDDSGRGGSGGD
jgi:hypothetical protein